MKSVDGVLVFDRYATEMEMTQLRISTDGNVEMAIWVTQGDLNGRHWIAREKYAPNVFQDILVLPPYPTHPQELVHKSVRCSPIKSEFLVWQDVSDTHFVEWGEDVDALRSRIEELEESLHGVERQKEEIEGIMNTLNRAIKELPSYVVDNCMTIEDMTSEMLDEYLSPFFT